MYLMMDLHSPASLLGTPQPLHVHTMHTDTVQDIRIMFTVEQTPPQ